MELPLAAAVLLVVVVSASDVSSCLGCPVEQCRPSSASLKISPDSGDKNKKPKKKTKNEVRKLKKVK